MNKELYKKRDEILEKNKELFSAYKKAKKELDDVLSQIKDAKSLERKNQKQIQLQKNKENWIEFKEKVLSLNFDDMMQHKHNIHILWRLVLNNWLNGPGYDTCMRQEGYSIETNLVAFKILISKKSKLRQRKLLEDLILKIIPYYENDIRFKIMEDSLSEHMSFSLENVDSKWIIVGNRHGFKQTLFSFDNLSKAITHIHKHLSYN